MSKYAFLAAMAFMMASGLALAQNAQPGVANAPPPRHPGQQFEPQPGPVPDFATLKSGILARMNENLADLQKRIPCVQAANDDQALRACMPPPHPGMRPMGAPGMRPMGAPGMGPMGAPGVANPNLEQSNDEPIGGPRGTTGKR